MGCTTIAATIIGVKISETDLHNPKVENVRGCRHLETPEKFCSKCGRKTWREESIDSYINPEELFCDGNEIGYFWGDDGRFVYIGRVLQVGEYDRERIAPVPDIEVLKQDLQKMLSVYDLWNEDSFKIYNLLYMSA